MTTDILFVAFNRLAFTQASFQCLLANTPWDQVNLLHVHDDASDDGTSQYLQEAIKDVPCSTRFESMPFRSPVKVMNRYMTLGPADWFVKVDNDACMPPGWLDALNTVRESERPDVIGMEAGMTSVANQDEPWDGIYRFEDCTHTGGIAMIRSAAITRPMKAAGRYGWGDYQRQAGLKRGWITPDLPVVLLDRLPFDPWVSLSEKYEKAGWQRQWVRWHPEWMAWAWHPFVGVLEGATAATVGVAA